MLPKTLNLGSEMAKLEYETNDDTNDMEQS